MYQLFQNEHIKYFQNADVVDRLLLKWECDTGTFILTLGSEDSGEEIPFRVVRTKEEVIKIMRMLGC